MFVIEKIVWKIYLKNINVTREFSVKLDVGRQLLLHIKTVKIQSSISHVHVIRMLCEIIKTLYLYHHHDTL